MAGVFVLGERFQRGIEKINEQKEFLIVDYKWFEKENCKDQKISGGFS